MCFFMVRSGFLQEAILWLTETFESSLKWLLERIFIIVLYLYLQMLRMMNAEHTVRH
jgi:hypothetical protein